MTDGEIREWYLGKLAAIADLDLEWQKQGLSPMREQGIVSVADPVTMRESEPGK